MEGTNLIRPVVIVGAGRSGTTMMREALSSHPDLAVCPYEMNYLWRSGSPNLSHDLLDPKQHFSEENAAYIRQQLAAILEEQGKPRLIEKTVANVMRIGFVNAVLPDALFIHIIRDGRAVTASAMKRWRAKPKASYFASKAKTIPLKSLPLVAFNYLKGRIRGVLRRRDYNQSWGPRWPGIDDDVKSLSLAGLCARQWVKSVEAALDQKNQLPPERYLEIHYEDVVANPETCFRRIAQFVGIDPDNEAFQNHVRSEIHDSGIDRWKRTLTEEQLAQAEEQAGPLLAKLNYPVGSDV